MASPPGNIDKKWKIIVMAALVLAALMVLNSQVVDDAVGRILSHPFAGRIQTVMNQTDAAGSADRNPGESGDNPDAADRDESGAKAQEAIQLGLAAFSSISLLISFAVERRSQAYRGFVKGILEFNYRSYNSHFVFLLLVVAMAEILCYKMIFGLSDIALQVVLPIHTILSLLLMCKTILFHQFGRNLDRVILIILEKRVDGKNALLMNGLYTPAPSSGKRNSRPGSASPDSKADAHNVERRLSALEIVKTLAFDTGKNYDIINQYDKIQNRYGNELLEAVEILLGSKADPDYFTKISPYWWYVMFSQITGSLIRGVGSGPCSQAGNACTELLSWFAAETAARLTRLRDEKSLRFRELAILTAIHASAVDSLSFREIMDFIRIFDRKCADMIAAEYRAFQRKGSGGQALSDAAPYPDAVPGLRRLLGRLYTALYSRGYYLETNILSEEVSDRHDALYSALSIITTIAYDEHFADDHCYLWQIWSTLDEMPPSVCYANPPDVASLRRPIVIKGQKARLCFRELYDLGKITS